MATKRPRGVVRPYLRDTPAGRWWYVALPGRRRPALGLRESEASYEEALRIACHRYASGALSPGGDGLPAEATLRDLVKTYLTEQAPHWKGRTHDGYALLLFAFEEAMAARGVTLASQVTSEAWSAYIAARQADVGNATINRTIAVVRPMAKWGRGRTPVLLPSPVYLESVKNLRELGRVASPVIPSPPEWMEVIGQLAEGVHEPAHPDAEDYRQRAEDNDRGLALFVAVAVQTGLRVDELRHLRAEDVGEDEVHVRAWGTFSPKSHRERTVPVPAATAAHAREMIQWRDGAMGLNGTVLALGEGWINKRLDTAWKKMRGKGDAPRMHDARRTFATELSRAGQPITLVRDRLGHADVETTERYLGRYRSDSTRVVPDLGLGAALGRKKPGR